MTGNQVTYEEYLLIIAESELPDNDWGAVDFATWKSPEWLGGGFGHLRNYKDDWIRDHATSITVAARMNGLPPELLAGTAWIEVGGDPTFIDGIAHDVYSFDHMADPLLEPLTIAKEPELASSGDVSIQIRRAAEELGLDPDNLSYSERNQILDILSNDQMNLAIVASHLDRLSEVDYPGMDVTVDQVPVIGARYNRGPELSLESIMDDTSYGDFIVDRWDRLGELLTEKTGLGLKTALALTILRQPPLVPGAYPVARGP